MIWVELHYEAMAGLLADPCLYSTIRVGKVDPETDETVEALYDEAGQYCEVIAQRLDTFHTDEYPANDLMRYLHWPDDPKMETAIRDKVHSAHITVEASGATLYAKLELDMTADLTIAEFEAFTKQVECQYQDGWGAEFELLTIPTSDEPVYLRLWHDEIAFFTGAIKERFLEHRRQERARFQAEIRSRTSPAAKPTTKTKRWTER